MQTPAFDMVEFGTENQLRAALVEQGPTAAAAHKAEDLLLAALGVAARVLVEDDKVNKQLLEAPVLVGPKQLTDDVKIVRGVDPHHHAGDPGHYGAGGERQHRTPGVPHRPEALRHGVDDRVADRERYDGGHGSAEAQVSRHQQRVSGNGDDRRDPRVEA